MVDSSYVPRLITMMIIIIIMIMVYTLKHVEQLMVKFEE